ncbi:MAG: hypothetical protein ACRD5K_12215 [Candidatus Acidiferrales bacterium]
MANFRVIHDVQTGDGASDWNLHFQWGEYQYEDGTGVHGYRFIWTRPDGSLQARPASIPSASVIFQLIHQAARDGWFIVCEGGARASVA